MPRQGPRGAGWLRTLRDYAVVVAGFLLVAGIYQHFAARPPELPEQAPGFSLPAADGSVVTLSELRGRVVVLNFWAPWCQPCMGELPTFADFARAHPEVAVVGVEVDGDPPEKLRELAEKLGLPYPVVSADGPTARAYRVSSVPMTVVVGPDGRIWSVHLGTMSRGALERAIQPPAEDS